MAGNGREIALEVLTACRKLEAWSDGTLKAACRRGGLDRRESAFAARLTYGVLQNAALLDFYLGQYCAQPVEKLEPFVRDVLRLGACQILLMDRVPDSAAVSQAVEMVKNHRRQRAADPAAGGHPVGAGRNFKRAVNRKNAPGLLRFRNEVFENKW